MPPGVDIVSSAWTEPLVSLDLMPSSDLVGWLGVAVRIAMSKGGAEEERGRREGGGGEGVIRGLGEEEVKGKDSPGGPCGECGVRPGIDEVREKAY